MDQDPDQDPTTTTTSSTPSFSLSELFNLVQARQRNQSWPSCWRGQDSEEMSEWSWNPFIEPQRHRWQRCEDGSKARLCPLKLRPLLARPFDTFIFMFTSLNMLALKMSR